MRLLHARHDRGCGPATRKKPRSHRRRKRARPAGEPLPMHRLSTHCPGGAMRRQEDEIQNGCPRVIPFPGGSMAEKFVGQRLKRTEDPRLIKGLAHYVDDIRLPDTLHAVFVRSIYAHARIKSVDVSEASKAPGVVAVYTGKD